MADDLDKEHLDHQEKLQSDHSEEIILGKETESIKPHQEVETMEVHKHPHHVTHKKKWGEYLLEFFMLFLAVFLGFIAENIRENVVEHERAKHYAKSLYQDIIQDTIKLNEAVTISNEIALKIDTLRNLCRGKKREDVKGGAIYYYSRFTFRHWGFNSMDATMQQLKSSGSLRFFNNYKLEDAIGKYDQSLRWLQVTISSDIENLSIGSYYRFQLLDANILDSVMSYTISREFINGFTQRQQPMVNYDKAKWTEYLNFAAARGASLKRIINIAYIPALESARKVIVLLKNQYHLQNE